MNRLRLAARHVPHSGTVFKLTTVQYAPLFPSGGSRDATWARGTQNMNDCRVKFFSVKLHGYRDGAVKSKGNKVDEKMKKD